MENDLDAQDIVARWRMAPCDLASFLLSWFGKDDVTGDCFADLYVKKG